MPVGLYWMQDVVKIQPRDIIVFRFQDSWLIKEVVGFPGDLFCVYPNGDFTLNQQTLGKAKTLDGQGKIIPRQSGCQKIPPEEWVVLGQGENSFDSRYFGSVKRRDILGKAIPAFTAKKSGQKWHKKSRQL